MMRHVQRHLATERPFTDSNPPGDCTRTAVACVLHLQLGIVPHFVLETLGDPRRNAWAELIISWAREVHDLGVGWFTADQWRTGFAPQYRTRVLGVAGGPTARGTSHHVVVDGCGDLVHDPHPSGLGIAEIEEVFTFGQWADDGQLFVGLEEWWTQ